MAGLSLDKIHELIGEKTNLIRGMPTVGIGTGDSAIAITSNFSISEEVKNMLFNLGLVIEMKEEHFDAFTAIVGAGPAYFALLAETLVEIAYKFVKKCMKVYIEGQLQTRKWQDSSGNDRYSTEVVLQKYRGELVILDKIESRSIDNSKNIENKSPIDEFNGKSSDLDDDIPF